MGSEEAVNIVRAALEPNADQATKQQALVVLRALVAVLETPAGAPLAVPPLASQAMSGQAHVAPPAATGDRLGMFIELIKSKLPPDQVAQLDTSNANRTRLNIPLISIPKP